MGRPQLFGSRITSLVNLVFVLLLLAVNCAAQESHVIAMAGRNKPVCVAYQKLLRVQQTDDYKQTVLEPAKKTFRCDRIPTSAIHELTQPKWSSLDVVENQSLIQTIENYLSVPQNAQATVPSRVTKVDPNWMQHAKDNGFMSLEVTQVDVNNDGKLDTAIKYRRNGNTCWSYDRYERPAAWATVLVVMDEKRTQVDVALTHLLMQNPSKEYVSNRSDIFAASDEKARGAKVNSDRFKEILKPTELAAGNVDFRGYDILRHDNQSYFDRWVEDKQSLDYGTLTVFRIRSGNAEQVCRFQIHVNGSVSK